MKSFIKKYYFGYLLIIGLFNINYFVKGKRRRHQYEGLGAVNTNQKC